MKKQLLQEAYDKFRLSLGQEPQPMSPKAMEYFCEAMDKYLIYKNVTVFVACDVCSERVLLNEAIEDFVLENDKQYCRKCQKTICKLNK